uniref:glutathione-regulated potassium-efflux system ancillary protein KefG n=1 Tax=Thaumasiovibrio occultus TaxID=1891184 RepID=UPI000B357633|nr:glutathione-regulated potassium-efflux system ancillary protein KefG [Thaumasiovibrio occultus]
MSFDHPSLPRILIILVHPDPKQSVANKALLQFTHSLPHVTVHDLYAHYPDFFIDVTRERALLAAHDVIVFQHPMYMYSCPALLKEWLDRVLSKDYAHGEGSALAGKWWRSVITTGGAEQAFSEQGYNRYGIEEILRPFELIADLCQMHWISPMVVYWARRLSQAELAEKAIEYHQWLHAPKEVLNGR